jgi:hypothetical protein
MYDRFNCAGDADCPHLALTLLPYDGAAIHHFNGVNALISITLLSN